jgi:hypothetical protein
MNVKSRLTDFHREDDQEVYEDDGAVGLDVTTWKAWQWRSIVCIRFVRILIMDNYMIMYARFSRIRRKMTRIVILGTPASNYYIQRVGSKYM